MIFTKNPEAGKVKTRLARDLGNNKALEIYKFLLKHSHEITAPLKLEKQVFYSSFLAENDIWETGGFEKKLQIDGDLGDKMQAAFTDAFAQGYQEVIIIGSDLYDISSADISAAFSELQDHDYVIGPAKDGGYYLLGMKAMNKKLFHGKNWSTSSVFEDSLKDMQDAKIKVLPEKNDIDMLDDIKDHPAFQNFIK
ncbi:glycosyltransferase [Christiangramia sabulilitoris]|uniref:Glycosyltransferase n=2 Tax=Christiangramia sabulilitoris TaxID=2583991 RepID=A0A550I0P7_9FLAO|nr:glycosyltransferase [Christiangramia sabulilitoris]